MTLLKTRTGALPLEVREGTILRVDGVERIAQRVLFLLQLKPGELLHRPQIGGDLGRHQNAPIMPATRVELVAAARRLLDTLPEVESYSVVTIQGATGGEILRVAIKTASGEAVRDMRI